MASGFEIANTARSASDGRASVKHRSYGKAVASHGVKIMSVEKQKW